MDQLTMDTPTEGRAPLLRVQLSALAGRAPRRTRPAPPHQPALLIEADPTILWSSDGTPYEQPQLFAEGA